MKQRYFALNNVAVEWSNVAFELNNIAVEWHNIAITLNKTYRCSFSGVNFKQVKDPLLPSIARIR